MSEVQFMLLLANLWMVGCLIMPPPNGPTTWQWVFTKLVLLLGAASMFAVAAVI